MNLREIFNNQITLGCDKWDPYFDVYETYFRKFVGKRPTVLEIGVQSGGSLQMWRKYFGPEAWICGVDIDPSILRHAPYYDDRTRLYIGDQGSKNFWKDFLVQCPQLDIIIDDGGHLMDQQITTFECLFPFLRNGGVFICEDTHTSYMEHIEGAGLHKPTSFIEYSKRLVDNINYQHVSENINFIEGLHSVHFYDSMVVFLKEEEKDFKRVIVNK